MWWFFKKIFENDKEIVYAYGYETRECTGRVRIDKKTEEIESERYADNFNEARFWRMAPHVWHICFEEGAPDERMVAVG